MILQDLPFRVFIGWDSREPEAYDVAAASLLRHAGIPLAVTALRQEALRAQRVYWRDPDPLASTEFTYTRFLTPLLAGYRGHAMFFDCDFLWTADVAELLATIDPAKAVSCVHHDHAPPEATKMEGAVQTRYPRKNWSSLMVFNCAHPAVRTLDAEAVNTQTGAWLQRMQWVADSEIGSIPQTWNWLEGWNTVAAGEVPKAIHFTRGGPWFPHWQHVQFADLWREEFRRIGSGGS